LKTLIDKHKSFGAFQGRIDIIDKKENLLDSSSLNPEKHWPMIADLIKEKIKDYRGIVITHGTDTLAYSAAALTFLCRHLMRPIILTASQVNYSNEFALMVI
jgi:L-asparaginase